MLIHDEARVLLNGATKEHWSIGVEWVVLFAIIYAVLAIGVLLAVPYVLWATLILSLIPLSRPSPVRVQGD